MFKMTNVKSLAAAVFALLALAQGAVVKEKRTVCPGSGVTISNAACCVWVDIGAELQSTLLANVCSEDVHETLRLTFHDAIGFSPSLARTGVFGGGGADGSIIAFSDIEETFPANLGTADMANEQRDIALRHGVSFGDMIYFAGTYAMTNCAGAPSAKFFAGRPNATAASPPNLVPDPFNTVTEILARMGDAGFTPEEVVALIASHTIAAQDHVEPTIHGSPFDSTPDTFDNQVFIEVQLRGTLLPAGSGGSAAGEVTSPLAGEIRLQSDHNLARDSRTACTWQSFAASQDLMVSKFKAAFEKMTLLGQDVTKMIDCSEVIPKSKPIAIAPHFPAGKTHADVEQACATAAFPNFPTLQGPPQAVSPVVQPA